MLITLTYHGLALHNGAATILERIDMELAGPGVCALLGPSGVGKSSLLRCTQRLIEDGREGWRRSGDVRFNGQSIFSSRAHRQQIARQIGFIQQNPRMLAGSVRANVEFALKHTTRLSRREIRCIADESLERVGLTRELPSLDFSAWKLSGGQAQRLALARAIALDPQVLLMDEPTRSLDPLNAERVEQIIRSIAAERLVVLVTHDVPMAIRIANFAAFMFRGTTGARIFECGDAPAVLENPRQAVVRQFVQTGRPTLVGAPSRRATPEIASVADAILRMGPQILKRLLRAAVGASGSNKPLRRLYLFVCGGNTFRSPLAEAFCNAEIASLLDIPHDELDRCGIRATSAGLSAQAGAPLVSAASDALYQLGAPSLDHSARHLTESLVEQADVIVCMTRGQCQTLAEKFPAATPKILRLDPQADIPDYHATAEADALPLARRIRDLVRRQLVNDLMSHLAQA